MSGIAGIIRFDGEPVSAATLEPLMAAISHRASERPRCEANGNVGLGFAPFCLGPDDVFGRLPAWTHDGAFAITADARLYGRQALVDRLRGMYFAPSETSDAALILEGYCRLGPRVLDDMDGDFAFAVWDAQNQCIFAARDVFGLKPLFYYFDGVSLVFGSEVKQVRAALPLIPQVNSAVAQAYLDGDLSGSEETFYRGIKRIQPGHFLLAARGKAAQVSYWKPWEREHQVYESRDHYIQRFRELFHRSVLRRIPSDQPAVLELSGGYDSSSIVVAAARLEREGQVDAASIRTLTTAYPGFACDESTYADAVCRQVPFQNMRFAATLEADTEWMVDAFFELDSPNIDIGWHRDCLGVALCHSFGAQVRISGIGGDDLLWDPTYTVDLLETRQYWRCVRHNLGLLMNRRIDLLKEEVRSVAWSLGLRGLRARVRERFGDAINQVPSGFPGAFQREVHGWLCAPALHRSLEDLECWLAHRGIEQRYPFLDRGLVEFVLTVPIEMRLPTAGRLKSFLRAAMRDDLPVEVRERGSKSTMDQYFIRLFLSHQDDLKALLRTGDRWMSGQFQSLERVDRCLETLNPLLASSWWRVRPAWAAATLELWMRQSPGARAA